MNSICFLLNLQQFEPSTTLSVSDNVFCLMSNEVSWLVYCHSHPCRGTIVILFNRSLDRYVGAYLSHARKSECERNTETGVRTRLSHCPNSAWLWVFKTYLNWPHHFNKPFNWSYWTYLRITFRWLDPRNSRLRSYSDEHVKHIRKNS